MASRKQPWLSAASATSEDENVTIPIAIPRSALRLIAPPAETVSQKTSLAVLGIDRRPFLESLAAYRADGGAVFELGKLRLVKREAFVAWLALKSGGSRLTAGTDDGVAAVVGELGLRLVGGGTARPALPSPPRT